MKRILSCLIAVVLLLAMLPAIGVASAEAAIAWPAEGEDVTIGGVAYTYLGETAGGVDYYDVGVALAYSCGAGYVLWDGESVLTLHNATLTETRTEGSITAVLAMSLGTIILEGENKIEASADAPDSIGIYLYDNDGDEGVYTIKGSGSLEINIEHSGDPSDTEYYYGKGIECEDDLVIDGAEISTTVVGTDSDGTIGVTAYSSLTLKDAKLICNVEGDGYTNGVYASDGLTATDSAILGSSVSTDDGTDEDSLGYIDFIECYGAVALTKTVVKGELNALIQGYGLYTEDDLLLDQSAVIFTYPGEYEYTNCSIYGASITFKKSYANVGGVIDTNGYYDESDPETPSWIPGVITLENTVLLHPTDAYLYKGYEDTELGWIDESDCVAVDVEYEGDMYSNYATDIMLVPKKFADVPNDAWYLPAVGFCNALGIVSGTGNGTTFNPSGTMTRAALVLMLYQREGSPAVSGDHGFSDVAADQWYTDAITWASQNGIVSGKGNGTFAPTEAVTRVSFVTALYNYAKYCGEDVSAGADLSGFADFEEIPSWAMDKLEWAVAEGLLSGTPTAQGLKVNPLGKATRAQGALLMQQFYLM